MAADPQSRHSFRRKAGVACPLILEVAAVPFDRAVNIWKNEIKGFMSVGALQGDLDQYLSRLTVSFHPREKNLGFLPYMIIIIPCQ
jgi:hypothetical protein